jgi:hypothetical protein
MEDMEDMEDMADMAMGVGVGRMTPRPQAKPVCNALRNKIPVINIDRLEIGF